MHRLKKHIGKISIAAFVGFLATIALCNAFIVESTKEKVYINPETIPSKNIALVLGTSHKLISGGDNPFFGTRIEMAAKLYKLGKVKHILVSGDNGTVSYNEPITMLNDLKLAGIPEEKIFLDYAGFRTLDSVVRAKEIFDTDNFLIISQKFHCERALFIANSHDINAKCFAVAGPSRHSGFQVRVREVFARTKAFLDIYIIHAQPKFLGPKEPIIKSTQADLDENEMIDGQDSNQQLTD